MTDLIKQARELCESATPGPWIRSKFGLNILTHDSEISTATQKYTGPSAYVADQMAALDANAAFIARSRTLIPELCDALEKAQAECEQMKTAISSYCRNDCYRDACTGNEDVGIPDCPMAKYAPPLPAPPEKGSTL